MKREVHGVFISRFGDMQDYIKRHPDKQVDFIYSQFSGKKSEGSLLDYEVTINGEREDKEKICDAILYAFRYNPLPLFNDGLYSILREIWEERNLWGTLVLIKEIRVKDPKKSEIAKRAWDTKRALALYKELPPAKVCSRLFEAMLSAEPTEVKGEVSPRPLDEIDKAMIIAIACKTGDFIRGIIRTEGIEAARPYMEYSLKDDGGVARYCNFPFTISMEFITSRVIDIFKTTQHREALDIDGLRERLWGSVTNISRPFLVTFSDEKGHKIKRVARFVSPAADGKYRYNVSILFIYLSQFYDIIDFSKICADFKIFGGEYLDFRAMLGAKRPSLGRTPLLLSLLEDPITEEEILTLEKISRQALWKRKKAKRDKYLKMIEAIDDTLEVKVNKDTIEVRSPKQQAATEAKKSRRKPRKKTDQN